MAELRSFIFLDRLQPQTMSYLGTWVRGALPRADVAAQIIEVAPGLDIEPLTDVALKYAEVQAGILVVERQFGYPVTLIRTSQLGSADLTRFQVLILLPGAGYAGLAALVLTWALIALALIDFDHQLLPDDITLPLDNPWKRNVRLADLAPVQPGRPRSTYRAVTESLIPRGEYQWSGVVSEITPEKLILRTRADGYKTILIRPDTRFLEDGVVSELPRLHPNTRIAIRAGKNLAGELEVYQIIWGQVTPR